MTHDSSTTVAACPRCLSQLAVPRNAPGDALLECPMCRVEFSLAGAAVRELPTARIIGPPPAPAPLLLDAPVEGGRPSAAAGTVPLAHAATVRSRPPGRDDARALGDSDPPLAALEGSSAHEGAITDSFANLIAKIELSESAAPATSGSQASRAAGRARPTIDERSHGIFAVRAAATPRRRRSVARLLTGVVAFGALGLALGAYALLWLKGAEGDVFQVARYLPDWLLPPSMQVAVQDAGRRSGPTAAARGAAEPDAAGPPAVAPLDDDGAALVADDGVKPAAASDDAGDEAVVPALATMADAAPAASATVWPVTALLAEVRGVQWFTLAELSQRLAAAEPAAAKFVGGGLAQADLIRQMGQAYVDLCALAEAYTLSEPVLSDSELFAKQVLAKAALRWAAAPARQGDLAVIAMRWLAHHHRANQGVLFVGTVREIASQGPWTEHVVEISLGDEHETVCVLAEGEKFAVGAVAGIAGAIIDRPRERIAGYHGSAPLAVIAGYAFDPGADDDARSASRAVPPPIE